MGRTLRSRPDRHFRVQDDVTRRIVGVLKVKLQPTEEALLGESRASNIEAHDCFLRGRELLLGSGPNEPYAYYAAAVVDTWKRNLIRAKAETERALALNPNYALAYGTRGLVEVYLGHPLAAIPFIERAIRLASCARYSENLNVSIVAGHSRRRGGSWTLASR